MESTQTYNPTSEEVLAGQASDEGVEQLELFVTDYILSLVGAEVHGSLSNDPLTIEHVTLVLTALVIAGARLFGIHEHKNLDPFIRFGIASYYHTHQANLAAVLENLSEAGADSPDSKLQDALSILSEESSSAEDILDE